ncbi:hypothetical protein [Pantanalinema sp. GBBB05]|uniref:hypothetical protein n=1 Tax=Pantanalinema sp. GBBB05 TaxID=2604139 RepID=UPI001DFF9058|nr:hypothetical protein [Pantanalinema sp. GBBB05]
MKIAHLKQYLIEIKQDSFTKLQFNTRMVTMRRSARKSEKLYINFGINKVTLCRLFLNGILGLFLFLIGQNTTFFYISLVVFLLLDLLMILSISITFADILIPIVTSMLIYFFMIKFHISVFLCWEIYIIHLLLSVLIINLFIREQWIFDKQSDCLIVNWYNFYEKRRETYSCELRRIVDFSIFESKVDIEDEPETFWGAVIVVKVLTKHLSLKTIQSPDPSFYPFFLHSYIFLSIEEAQKNERKIRKFLDLY